MKSFLYWAGEIIAGLAVFAIPILLLFLGSAFSLH